MAPSPPGKTRWIVNKALANGIAKTVVATRAAVREGRATMNSAQKIIQRSFLGNSTRNEEHTASKNALSVEENQHTLTDRVLEKTPSVQEEDACDPSSRNYSTSAISQPLEKNTPDFEGRSEDVFERPNHDYIATPFDEAIRQLQLNEAEAFGARSKVTLSEQQANAELERMESKVEWFREDILKSVEWPQKFEDWGQTYLVEITMKEICKHVWPINNPRRIVQKIRKDCTKCRLIAKKTLELRMMNLPPARTTISPPFYICQIDTVYGFTAQYFKGSRKLTKVYALIICCLLTGATSILALEGLETRDVLQALERHACRYGMPSIIYVDNGSQLLALKNTSFSLRNAQHYLSDSFGIEIRASTAKSHEEQGRVESRVRIMRQMMEKFCSNTKQPLTFLQWETLFAKISNEINDLPIAKTTRSQIDDPVWDLITPNRLILGRNNQRSLTDWVKITAGSDSERLVRKNREILETWYTIFLDRLHHLMPRPPKWNRTDPVSVDDVVLFLFSENVGNKIDNWKIGKVKRVVKPNEVEIEFCVVNDKGKVSKRTLQRSPRNLSVIIAANELSINSHEYFKKLCHEEQSKNCRPQN